MEEILFDPQTSGGLLIAAPSTAQKNWKKSFRSRTSARIVGELTEKGEKDITVYKEKKG